MDALTDRYILVGKVAVPEPDLGRWGQWMAARKADKGRHVAESTVGPLWISTVFLGLDHNFGLRGPPLLFETMIFDSARSPDGYLDDISGYQTRCSTWGEAERMHEEAVAHATVLVAAAEALSAKIGGIQTQDREKEED